MGKVSKGVKCSVVGCEERAVRSIASQRVPSSMKVEVEGRRAYLCEKHYKEFKKLTRTERKVERWRYSTI
ncbi:MAG: hypothetical protein J7K49_03330 [Thaumarchaeota archaeon]|nr:hypothetical protein [Nitrososphaerota archaeon]RLF99161.1 MAG: hypothetical protein DRN47_04145 [Candidatus Wolframiiraptor sp.]RLG07765.1 MAG: hypothetical protein DRN65_02915 [Nitrososphaerota archaeon]HDD40013.1 hypothetical protein [Nitrososphaeria archaeon]